MKSFPADVLEDRAGEVVNHRVQHAVEIGQADGDVKRSGQVFQSRADFRFRKGAGYLLGPDPNQQLRDIAREEANDEERRHNCNETQSLLDLCMLGQLSPSQVANNLECTVENHQQRDVEGKDELEFMPGQISLGFSLDQEALTVGCVVFQSEDMSCH